MTYRIETAQQDRGRARPWPARDDPEATVVLVGCGGTGGFLTEAVCRLLLGRRAELFLVDMDRVEPHNVARQAFDRADVGHFKARVLAERLSRRFGREVGYSVLPYDRRLHAEVFAAPSALRLLVGCVDTAAARRALAATLDAGPAAWQGATDTWWLDTGNGRNAGQVLLGNATRAEQLRGAFDRGRGTCRALPAPGLQRPDLLQAPPLPDPRSSRPPGGAPDCAEAVAADEQGGTINQVVAAVAAGFVERLLAGTCPWMGAYFDLDDGTLRSVSAEPGAVAALVGLHPNAVAPPVPAARRDGAGVADPAPS
jgi:PRTRC genetic system ThiF family protein